MTGSYVTVADLGITDNVGCNFCQKMMSFGTICTFNFPNFKMITMVSSLNLPNIYKYSSS